jgi:asparaginyl-tRNA synthetase
VHVHAWVKSIRRQKRVAFAELSDGSTLGGLQAVFGDVEMAKGFVFGLVTLAILWY